MLFPLLNKNKYLARHINEFNCITDNFYSIRSSVVVEVRLRKRQHTFRNHCIIAFSASSLVASGYLSPTAPETRSGIAIWVPEITHFGRQNYH